MTVCFLVTWLALWGAISLAWWSWGHRKARQS